MSKITTSENLDTNVVFGDPSRAFVFLGVGAGICCLALISIGRIPTGIAGMLFMLFAIAIGFRQTLLIYLFLIILLVAKFLIMPEFEIAKFHTWIQRDFVCGFRVCLLWV